MKYQQIKFGSFCSHSYQKSFTNKIQLLCNRDDKLTHVVSQIGKICNKCAELLTRSLHQNSDQCLVCQDKIEQYLKEKQICSHDNQQFDQVTIKCKQNQVHFVPLKVSVCQTCLSKIIAAFNISETCKVCEGKQNEILDSLEKNMVSPIFAFVKGIISFLKEQQSQEKVIKEQLEHFCKAEIKIQDKQFKSILPKEYLKQEDASVQHMSKRYSLYPKCVKHRNQVVKLCNKCLVAILNLQCCPYGCEYPKTVSKAKGGKTQDHTTISQCGFLFMFPQQHQQSYYLDLFIIRQTEEKGRLDRWGSILKKIRPINQMTVKFKNYFALYNTSTLMDNFTYLNCGGVLGSTIHNKQPTNIAFLLRISSDMKNFEIRQTAMMKFKRASHAAVYHAAAKRVYVVGGYIKQQGCLRSCQYYNTQTEEWVTIGELNIERSKPTIFIYRDQLYTFGGMTANPKIAEGYAERYDEKSQSWKVLNYKGYDYPSLTGSVSLTNLPIYQNKEAMYLIGGSNYQDYSSMIQCIDIDENRDTFEFNFSNAYLTMNSPRCNGVLGLINSDIVIVFGGLKEHESLINVQAIKIRTIKNSVQPLFVYEQVQLGSYRLMLRESSDHIYNKLYQNLESEEILSKEKLSKEDLKLINSHNCHLFEKMHYTIGKNFVWVPMTND